MLVKRILTVSVLAYLLVGVCGCAPTIIGSDAGVYSRGTLYAVASRDITTVYNATLNALVSLELEVTEKSKDVFSAKVIATAVDARKITIKIKPGEAGITNFSIAVSGRGSKHRTRVIYDRIRQNLDVNTGK
ncbi:MAG: DUF3568 family protein [Planctomycetota bacterium]|jgi:hypothetical protein